MIPFNVKASIVYKIVYKIVLKTLPDVIVLLLDTYCI